MTIVFTVLGLLVFNLYPGMFAPVLDLTVVRIYLPYWNALWIGTILVNLLLLSAGTRTAASGTLDAIVSFASLYVTVLVLRGPALISSALSANLSVMHLNVAPSLIWVIYRGILWLTVFGTAIDAIRKAYLAVVAISADH